MPDQTTVVLCIYLLEAKEQRLHLRLANLQHGTNRYQEKVDPLIEDLLSQPS